MRFSERMGFKKPKKLIQIDSMDDNLRNSLWNAIIHIQRIISDYFMSSIFNYDIATAQTKDLFYLIDESIWELYFKETLDSRKEGKFFRERFFEFKWVEVYEYLEFIINLFYEIKLESSISNGFVEIVNEVLIRENSGYRIINKIFVPITSENEILEIEEVLESSEKFLLEGVQTHFEESLKKLSDKQNPDYRNSIKESISAVESICKIISGKPSATLNDALKHIEKNDKINLHKALKAGFDKIYAYAGDEKGVRHALMDESDLDFEDAKFMLVSCSAFVNYLIVKADKAGIELTSK